MGAGTGRITKIMLEEFPDINRYDAIEIYIDVEKTYDHKKINWYPIDITDDKSFDLLFGSTKRRYDLILASEVFMHIKPEDIESVLERLTNLLAPNGVIVNIDFQYETPSNKNSTWCFIHSYDELYRKNGLYPVFIADMKEICQKLFCYGK